MTAHYGTVVLFIGTLCLGMSMIADLPDCYVRESVRPMSGPHSATNFATKSRAKPELHLALQLLKERVHSLLEQFPRGLAGLHNSPTRGTPRGC